MSKPVVFVLDADRRFVDALSALLQAKGTLDELELIAGISYPV